MSVGNLEEILKMVEHVRHKKMEGSLYLMSERIGWMPKQKDTFLVSHNYVDIKTQKISAEKTAKIQLQIVLHDDSSSTFHFASPQGAAQQLKDRDQVKDELAKLLPKFKQKISHELEEKKKILLNNPHIYQLYNDLVIGKIVSAGDFWKNYVDFNVFKHQPKDQLTGVSQGFMANICPKSDGSSGLVFNISNDDILSIFKTYPTVKQKYMANVPHKISEKDFWTKFFQSYYFRRDQITTTSTDLFDDCPKKDAEELKNKTERTLADPIIVFDNQKEHANEDGFGLNDFIENKSLTMSSKNLVKSYNYYSMRVLSSMDEMSSSSASASNNTNSISSIGDRSSKDHSTATAASRSNMPNKDEIVLAMMKNTLLLEDLDDLQENGGAAASMNPRGAQLNLTQTDRYFYAPKSNEATTNKVEQILKANNPELVARGSLEQLYNWKLNTLSIIDPILSMKILNQLTPGSDLMKISNVQDLKDEIPKAKQDELRALYISSAEMLRHFYACFPPINADLENKMNLMREALDAFYHQKVLLFRDQLHKENFPWNLTSHLESMFHVAFDKYKNWKSKQT